MSDLKKIRWEILMATDNLNRVDYLQELVKMMRLQFEVLMSDEQRQSRIELLLESYQRQIDPELEELRSRLETAESELQVLVSSQAKGI